MAIEMEGDRGRERFRRLCGRWIGRRGADGQVGEGRLRGRSVSGVSSNDDEEGDVSLIEVREGWYRSGGPRGGEGGAAAAKETSMLSLSKAKDKRRLPYSARC